MRQMQETADAIDSPLRIWISFADVAPENLQVVQRLTSPFRLSLKPSGVRWPPWSLVPKMARHRLNRFRIYLNPEFVPDRHSHGAPQTARRGMSPHTMPRRAAWGNRERLSSRPTIAL